MSVVRKQAGAQSVSFYVTADAGPVTEFDINASEWAVLPSGKLKDLLSATYLTEAGDIDPAAFMEAYAEAGAFQITSQYDDQDTGDSYWFLVAAAPVAPTDPPKGSPVLHVAAEAYGTSVRVSTSYSASA